MSMAAATDVFYTVTALTGGTTYTFKVHAYNKYGYGDFSTNAVIMTA